MALDPKDLEAIERVVYKNADDIAVSISRSFERIEERVDTAESRLSTRLADVEDRIESSRADLSDHIAQVRGDTRELLADEQQSFDGKTPPARGVFSVPNRGCRGAGSPSPSPLPPGSLPQGVATNFGVPPIRASPAATRRGIRRV